MRATQATIDLLNEYYGAMEANDPQRYGTYYADDMTLTFGNNPTVKGRENVVAAVAEGLEMIRSLHHDVMNVWEEPGGVVVYELVGVWNLFDGTSISTNGCVVSTVVGGEFADQRVYVDNTPVFAAIRRAART